MLEAFLEVSDVIFCLQRFNKHIININFHGLTYEVCEHLVDESLIGCSCVFLSKRHDLVAIDSSFGDESSFFLVIRVHEDLVVS